LCGKPLVLHEQNSVAGMANKVLARVAQRVFSAFPDVMPNVEWVGNPMREGFVEASPRLRSGLPNAVARCVCWWWAAVWAHKP
jgi:UDP-N-acetylglucosamine--N-acetylmuramyl-(pentapeptide) pyrophosphoryl-undecaprenol N-acetylglucosamine transferase